MTTDLIPTNIHPEKLFAQNGLEPVLQEIKRKVDEFSPDTATAKGRKEISSFAYKIAQSKSFLDRAGKSIVADKKAEIKKVDQERKRARDFLDSEKERARKPLTEWETAKREEEERKRLDAEFQAAFAEALEMNALFDREKELKRKEEEFARIEAERKAKAEEEERARKAEEEKKRIAREAEERAKREYEEKIKAEKERSERLEREAKEAAERAEREKKEAAERAEIERKAAAEMARKEAEERARAEKEAEEKRVAAEKAEADRLAARGDHRAAVNQEILKSLIGLGLSEKQGIAVICAVAKGQIERLEIRY